MSEAAATVRYAFTAKKVGRVASIVPEAAEGPAAPVGRVPRVARLLALAHKFQGMLDRGEVASMADIAQLGRVSRARVTQIMDLLLLAPDIQEKILFLPAVEAGRDKVTLRQLMPVCAEAAWAEQRGRWRNGVFAGRALTHGASNASPM